MVHLEKVSSSNVWDVLRLKPKESQRDYVAPNDISIIEAYVAKEHAHPFGVYDGDQLVGFVMIGYGVEKEWKDAPRIAYGNYSIWRLMIDQEHQGKGYGRKALELALSWVNAFPCGKARFCWLSYDPDNDIARNLYHSFGFVETGEMDGDEKIAILPLRFENYKDDTDMTVTCGPGIVNVRAGAIIIKDGKVLMAGNRYVDFLYSVGGRLKFGETSEQAIVREVFEETGTMMEVDHLGFVHENYFIGDYKGTFGQEIYEIAFYYYMKVPNDWNPVSYTSEIEHLVWIDLNDEHKIFPSFFREELKHPEQCVKHYVTDDRYHLGDIVTVTIDRPLGSVHPLHDDIVYPVNYGYIKGIYAKDGEEQDAYVLGVDEPVEEFTGTWIATIHRLNDNEDKWVIASEDSCYSKEEIARLVHFQEMYFLTEIHMKEDDNG